jgi:hypothetical protein
MKREFVLAGPEVDNLLGFLAVLGLLRALEKERAPWQPRVYFDGIPLSARLVVREPVSEEDVADAAAAGCAAYAPYFEFGQHQDLNFEKAEARRLLEAGRLNPTAASIMSALFCDAAYRPDKDNQVDPTVLCAMFGQGHQHFLERLGSVSRGTVPRALAGKRAPDLNSSAYIGRALFQPWSRRDPTESFRWDFAEDRRYATRAINPSNDAPTTEHGANRLALLGLVCLQSAPVVQARRGVVVLATRAVSRGADRQPRITWPIWDVPATLDAILALLDEPEFAKDTPDFSALRGVGVGQARRVVRLISGKFFNFSRAVALT